MGLIPVLDREEPQILAAYETILAATKKRGITAGVHCGSVAYSRRAIENMESILDVEGIDGVYIGPSDLGFSYGLVPKLDREEPEILKIYEKIVKECGKRGLYPGIHCSGADGALRGINMGFRLVTLFNDSGLMATYAKMQIAKTRSESNGKA